MKVKIVGKEKHALNIDLSFNNLISDNETDFEWHQGTLDDFPELSEEYNFISAQINKDFIKWRRWNIQLLSHQLRANGYFF